MPNYNEITDRPSPQAEAAGPVEFAPEVRAVADAYRAAKRAGVIAPWRWAEGHEEGPLELSVAIDHDTAAAEEGLCSCAGCGVSDHHRAAADAARAGDQLAAEHHQRIGDAYFRLSEAARAGQLPGRLGSESVTYAEGLSADMRQAIAESGTERSDQEAEAER
jgi:hypothetical protein